MEKISNSDAAHHQYVTPACFSQQPSCSDLTDVEPWACRELFYFLEAELNMVDQIREELLRVKSGWVQSQEPPYAYLVSLEL